jgi:hypothetical protein
MKRFILRIYTFFILDFFSFLISFKAKNASDLILRKNSSKKKIFFLYYKSIDIELINLSIIKNLKKKNTIHTNNINEICIKNFIKIKKNKNLKELYRDIKKQCKKFKISTLYYPIIDSLHYEIRTLDYSSIGIKNIFFKKIKNLQKKISLIAKKFDILILSDSAYLFNNIFKQEFIKNKKKVLGIMSRGIVFELKKINYGECNVNKKSQNYYISEYKNNSNEIENYMSKRYFGLTKNKIFDESFVSKKKILNNISKNKKILFINEFVDAANISWKNKQIFSSNIEWTEFSLEVLKKINFKDFYIKFHPLTKFFPYNNQIVDYLKNKYEIPKIIMEECPDLKTILKNKLSTYSHNGTIVLDTLVYNYKTNFCGSRFDESYGNKANNKSEWKNLLLNDSLKNIYQISPNIKKHAKYILWRDFEFQNIKNLSPDTFIAPWHNRLEKLMIFINQLKNIFLKKTYCEKNTNNKIIQY